MKIKKQCHGRTKNGTQCNRMIRCLEKNNDPVYCKTHRPNVYEKEDCAVCTDSVNIPLSCGHWIHNQCVIQSGKANCPICRSQINLTKEEYEKTMEYDRKYKQQFLEEDEEELLQIYNNDIPMILQIISEALTGELLFELEEGASLHYNMVLNTDGITTLTNNYINYLDRE